MKSPELLERELCGELGAPPGRELVHEACDFGPRLVEYQAVFGSPLVSVGGSIGTGTNTLRAGVHEERRRGPRPPFSGIGQKPPELPRPAMRAGLVGVAGVRQPLVTLFRRREVCSRRRDVRVEKVIGASRTEGTRKLAAVLGRDDSISCVWNPQKRHLGEQTRSMFADGSVRQRR